MSGRRAYTPEDVAEALRRKAVEVGRVPRASDFLNARGGYPTWHVICGRNGRFPSFHAALDFAGLLDGSYVRERSAACPCGHAARDHDGFGCARCGCDVGPPVARAHVERVAALPLSICHDYATGVVTLDRAEDLARALQVVRAQGALERAVKNGEIEYEEGSEDE